jgi:hypothetical protein
MSPRSTRNTRRSGVCGHRRSAPAGLFQRGRGDLIDLSGVGRNQVFDALAGALCVPALDRAAPRRVLTRELLERRGASHVRSDRRGRATARGAGRRGVEQVIAVCPDSERSAPHRLENRRAHCGRACPSICPRPRRAPSGRRVPPEKRFKGIFLIQPLHNPIGPLDFEGTYDERSDRYQSLGELVDRGYEDAYRQFVEP